MSYDPQNVGKARMLVEILPSSPFSGIPQQEFGYFFKQDNLGSMTSSSNIEALPDPFGGFRIVEKTENYDNFLVDTGDTYLEKAVQTGSVTPVSSEAFSNAAIAQTARNPSAAQKQFFTWKVSENLFAIQAPPAATAAASTTATTAQTTPNPAPATFADAATRNDNIPKWTYNLKVKPGAGQNSTVLSPFMNNSTNSNDKAIHWGVTMVTALARNQPFEIFYYHEQQLHTVADNAKLAVRFTGLESLDLGRKAYLAIEMGKGTQHHFLILFVQDLSPQFYSLGGGGQNRNATLVSEFSTFSGEKLFDLQHFTVKFEPVAAGMVITSNLFSDTPWIVNIAPNQPVFVGEGPLSIYSGNVQSGFLMRPIQYESKGQFVTPQETIVQTSGDTRQPTVTAALKGAGDVEQNSSYDSNGSAQIFAVDAEKVNGQSVKTFIQAQAQETPLLNGSRKITLLAMNVPDVNQGQPPSTGPSVSGSIKKSVFQTQITLLPTDTTQGNGFVVQRGRSSYIWQARLELPQLDVGAATLPGTDISCDVLTCDLTWNATSYNELSHTGTIKVQNKPRTMGLDYRNFTNRAVYFRISAWWDSGGGHDPGNPNNDNSSDRVIFNGMSVGATVETKRELETVTFKLEDYMNALEGGKFILSPYYDGMNASLAVRDIVKQLGVADNNIIAGDSPITGQQAPADAFILPFANPFEEPQFRFKDGSSYKSAVVKIATLDGKTVFFDNLGRFHYDDIPGGIFGDENTPAKIEFFSSISAAPEPKVVVWNMSSFSRAVNDTYNVLQVSTVDKETGALIHIADANEASLHDPQAEGYLGYRKHLLIREPALGSAAAAGKYFQSYRERVFIPPLTARFETYGYSGLHPLDTVSLDGQKLRILNLEVHMDAKENQYWMNVEGEWFFSAGKWQNQSVSDDTGQTPANSGNANGT